MNEDVAAIREALASLQQQVDMMTAAHDARAESAQVALDDLRDIVCDPTNPRNHESRLVAAEVKIDRVESEQSSARRERRGLLDAIPSGEEIGKIGDGLSRWRRPALVTLVVVAVVYLAVFGDPIGAFERIWRIVNSPVTVQLDQPVPVTNVPAAPAPAPDTTSTP